MGTSLSVTAMRTSRWWGLRSRLDGVLENGEELRGLGILMWGRARLGEKRPALGLERHLPSLPCAAADLRPCLEERELVRPGGEAAVAAEVVELAQDGDKGVVRALLREVVEVVAAQVRKARPAAGDLGASCLEEDGRARRDRGVTLRALRAQPVDPRLGLRVEASGARHRRVARWRSASDAVVSTAARPRRGARGSGLRAQEGSHGPPARARRAGRRHIARQGVGELWTEARLPEATRAPQHDRVGSRALDRVSFNRWHGLLAALRARLLTSAGAWRCMRMRIGGLSAPPSWRKARESWAERSMSSAACAKSIGAIASGHGGGMTISLASSGAARCQRSAGCG